MARPTDTDFYEPKTTTDLREWFSANAILRQSVWIVIFKKSTNKQVVSFEDVIEEAICHGWIDSKTKTVDESRYAIYLTPRKPTSHWTEANKLIAQRMIADNRMTNGGMDVFTLDR